MQSIFAENALLPDGWATNVNVRIGDDGHVAEVAPNAAADTTATRVPVLVPAVSNLHSHTFQRAMAGLAERRGPNERDSFWTWREVMYRFLDILTPDEIEAVAALAFVEMLEAGFAAVAEFHYLHNQPGGDQYDDIGELAVRIAAAASQSGIGLTLLPVYYRQGGVDGRPLKGGQLRFANELDSFGNLVARSMEIAAAAAADTGFGIAPHSLRAVPAADLAELAGWQPQLPLHMHIAEQEAEIEETLAVLKGRPVEWLLGNHDVDDRWCLIHCTHMTPDEASRLGASGAVAGLCPVTEANLGDGIFDAPTFLKPAGNFGVGSDSNISISVAGELRQLEYSQRLRDRARVVLAEPKQSAGRRLYLGALSGGMRALNRNSGEIAAGRWADLLALSAGELSAFGAKDLVLDEWIFTGGAQVRDVWAAGRHMVRDGSHVSSDAIRARYRTVLQSLGSRL